MTSNTGVAFSLPIPPLLTIPLSIGVVVLFIYCYYHSFAHHSLAKMTTALIIGGALGNLIDRLLYGSVIDFIKIYSWPTFNIADICLTIGFLLLILFFDKIKISMN